MTQPVTPAPAAEVPGKTLGIVGVILAILFPLIGLIVSIIAANQSKAAGVPNTPAKAGIIISIVLMALYIIIWIVTLVIGLGAAASYS